MIAKLTMKLDSCSEAALSYQMSSLFHGVLLEQVDCEYGMYLHQSNLKPFSQHLVLHKDEALWIINVFSQKAYEQMIVPLMREGVQEIYLKHRELHIPILEKKCELVDVDAIMEQTIFSTCSRYLNIRFATPTAFKSDGEYVFYPTIRHIFNSLIQKFDVVNEQVEIYTPELLNDIETNLKISRYNLRSTYFSLEGVKIPAFVGEITIKVRGPQPLVNIVHLLVRFGEYAGVGIKTAMGMGHIEITERGEQRYAGRTN